MPTATATAAAATTQPPSDMNGKKPSEEVLAPKPVAEIPAQKVKKVDDKCSETDKNENGSSLTKDSDGAVLTQPKDAVGIDSKEAVKINEDNSKVATAQEANKAGDKSSETDKDQNGSTLKNDDTVQKQQPKATVEIVSSEKDQVAREKIDSAGLGKVASTVLIPEATNTQSQKSDSANANAVPANAAPVIKEVTLAEKETSKEKSPTEENITKMETVAAKKTTASETGKTKAQETSVVEEAGNTKAQETPVVEEAGNTKAQETSVVEEAGKTKAQETEAGKTKAQETPVVEEAGNTKGQETSVVEEAGNTKEQETSVVEETGKTKAQETSVVEAVETLSTDNIHPSVIKARKAGNFKREVKGSDQLPSGWIVHIHQRQNINKMGQRVYDLYWFTNTGKRLRSHTEIVRFLGHLKDSNGDESVAWQNFKAKIEPKSTVQIKQEGRELYLPETTQKAKRSESKVKPKKKTSITAKSAPKKKTSITKHTSKAKGAPKGPAAARVVVPKIKKGLPAPTDASKKRKPKPSEQTTEKRAKISENNGSSAKKTEKIVKNGEKNGPVKKTGKKAKNDGKDVVKTKEPKKVSGRNTTVAEAKTAKKPKKSTYKRKISSKSAATYPFGDGSHSAIAESKS